MSRFSWRTELLRMATIVLCYSVTAKSLPGVDLNDPSVESDEFWQQYYARLSEQQRPLENNSWVEVSAQAGDRAALSCRVKHLGSRPVSWIRRRDFHVLTSRSTVFTADARFSVQHRSGPVEDWALSVSPVTADDSGVYECQVSTGQGTLSQLVNLTVIQPAARILGPDVHRIEEGADVTVLCVIDQAVSDVGAIVWWRDNRSVAASGRLNVQSESSPTADGGSPRSQLHVRRATFLDSGLYTCGGQHVLADSVQVMVTEGDKMAAIQRRGGAGAVSACLHQTLLLLLVAAAASLIISGQGVTR